MVIIVMRYVPNIHVTEEFICDLKEKWGLIHRDVFDAKMTKAQETNSEKLWTFSLKFEVFFL
jgi:hypothetical protein